MLTEEELLMCVKEFEEHNKRKRSQVKENVHREHQSSYKSKVLYGEL